MGTSSVNNEFPIQMEEEDDDEEKWSQLPALLIWMIKWRVTNIIDDLHLACVCKNWNSASQSCPSKPFQPRCVAPWLLQQQNLTTTSEFVNLSTNEKLILDIPEFYDQSHHFLFSRRGWLLFGWPRYSVVLVNPHTDARIRMPWPKDCIRGSFASFSSDDDNGTPRYVVFAEVSNTITSVSFHISCVGDAKWSKHTYANGRQCEASASLVVYRDKIYRLAHRGGLLIFDMVTHVWKELIGCTAPVTPISFISRWIMEYEGDIVKIVHCGNLKTCSFSKLNESQNGWEEIIQTDRDWYVHCRNNHFTVKEENPGGTRKIYSLTRSSSRYYKVIVNILDLTDRLLISYNSPRKTCEGEWVDLGPVYRKPASCIRYVPPKSAGFVSSVEVL